MIARICQRPSSATPCLHGVLSGSVVFSSCSYRGPSIERPVVRRLAQLSTLQRVPQRRLRPSDFDCGNERGIQSCGPMYKPSPHEHHYSAGKPVSFASDLAKNASRHRLYITGVSQLAKHVARISIGAIGIEHTPAVPFDCLPDSGPDATG